MTSARRRASSGDPLALVGSLTVLVAGAVALGADVTPSTTTTGTSVGDAVALGADVAPSTTSTGTTVGEAVAPWSS
jgi:hypothetical protein